MGLKKYADDCGMCVTCLEWTTVGESCCGKGVMFEGSFVADYECDCSMGDGGESPEVCEHCAKESA